jgi:hypothetical protein
MALMTDSRFRELLMKRLVRFGLHFRAYKPRPPRSETETKRIDSRLATFEGEAAKAYEEDRLRRMSNEHLHPQARLSDSPAQIASTGRLKSSDKARRGNEATWLSPELKKLSDAAAYADSHIEGLCQKDERQFAYRRRLHSD